MTAHTTKPQPLIGVTELAARLGVSRDYIYRMKELDTFPRPVRIGALWKWDPALIEAWLRREQGADGQCSEAV